MAFDNNKKDSGLLIGNRPLESAAINRWRNLNVNPELDQFSETQTSEIHIEEETPRDESVQVLSLDQVFEEDESNVIRLIEEDEEYSTGSLQEEIEIPLQASIEIEETKVVKKAPSRPPLEKANFDISPEEDLRVRFGNNIQSALGSGTMIEGRFSFETPVRIDGSLKGEIKSSSALIVGKNATVNGNIKVGSLIILGSVEGEVQAEDLIEIRSSGTLLGDVITNRIALEEGGLFSGSCTMID